MSKVEKIKVGRPKVHIFTDEIMEKIYDLIVTGHSMREISTMKGMPHITAFYREMRDNEEFRTIIAHAREMQQEHEADYMIELADSATPEDFNVKKLQIWARQWRAGKLAPKKYGDKTTQEITGPNGGPLQSTTLAITPHIEAEIMRIANRVDAIQSPAKLECSPPLNTL